MQQRDLLKDEIERLGQTIGKMIASLLKTSSGNNPGLEWRQAIEDELMEGLDLSLEDLLNLEREVLLQTLSDKNLTPVHFEQLADLLHLASRKEEDPGRQLQLLERALLLYDLAATESGDYSFSRAEKEREVAQRLSALRSS